MIEIDEYQQKLMHIESDLTWKLYLLYVFLMQNMNKKDKLTINAIDAEFAIWQMQTGGQFKDIFTEHIDETVDIASNAFYKNYNGTETRTDYTAEKSKFYDAEVILTGGVTEYTKEKYKTLSVLENTYGASDGASDNYTVDLDKQVKRKCQLLAWCTTQNMSRQILFLEAIKAGYTQYLWMTQRDDRVRDSHEKMEGVWVDIDKAPKITGYCHVGEAINCRCYILAFR